MQRTASVQKSGQKRYLLNWVLTYVMCLCMPLYQCFFLVGGTPYGGVKHLFINYLKTMMHVLCVGRGVTCCSTLNFCGM